MKTWEIGAIYEHTTGQKVYIAGCVEKSEMYVGRYFVAESLDSGELEPFADDEAAMANYRKLSDGEQAKVLQEMAKS